MEPGAGTKDHAPRGTDRARPARPARVALDGAAGVMRLLHAWRATA